MQGDSVVILQHLGKKRSHKPMPVVLSSYYCKNIQTLSAYRQWMPMSLTQSRLKKFFEMVSAFLCTIINQTDYRTIINTPKRCWALSLATKKFSWCLSASQTNLFIWPNGAMFRATVRRATHVILCSLRPGRGDH